MNSVSEWMQAGFIYPILIGYKHNVAIIATYEMIASALMTIVGAWFIQTRGKKAAAFLACILLIVGTPLVLSRHYNWCLISRIAAGLGYTLLNLVFQLPLSNLNNQGIRMSDCTGIDGQVRPNAFFRSSATFLVIMIGAGILSY